MVWCCFSHITTRFWTSQTRAHDAVYVGNQHGTRSLFGFKKHVEMFVSSIVHQQMTLSRVQDDFLVKYVCVYVCIYIYTHDMSLHCISIYIYIYVYIYMYTSHMYHIFQYVARKQCCAAVTFRTPFVDPSYWFLRANHVYPSLDLMCTLYVGMYVDNVMYCNVMSCHLM